MLLVTCSAPWPHDPDRVMAACQQQPQCRVAELHQATHGGEDPVKVSCSLVQKIINSPSVKQWRRVRTAFLQCQQCWCRVSAEQR